MFQPEIYANHVQDMCFASQLTGFYMRATLALNGLTISQKAYHRHLLDCSD